MSLLRRYYRGDFRFDFLGRQRVGLAISAVAVLLGLGSLLVRGLDLGVDFEGGNVWQVPAAGASVGEVRDALRPLGQETARIQVLGGDTVRVQTVTLPPAEAEGVTAALADLAGVPATEVSVSEVGPSWGADITATAVRALLVFFAAVTLYISLRFEWKMAVAALASVFHDIVVSVGVYSLFGFEVTPATVIAFLTILGYSLYDTIVVFDKVQENSRGRRGPGSYVEIVNRSMNEVLNRSINTTLTSLLPVGSLLVVGALVFGATTLREFAVALFVGLLSGAYSSLFVAAPILAWLKGREPRYGQGAGAGTSTGERRAGAGARRVLIPSGGGRPPSGRPDAPTGDAGRREEGAAEEVGVPTPVAPGRPGGGGRSRPDGPAPRGGVAPRGRKKGRRRSGPTR